ncbi:hypothetical protein PINS_up005834 [Pythium insidiosum]|nr:hypothetical protein PINS_up005834 [Pythium insidiosum]
MKGEDKGVSCLLSPGGGEADKYAALQTPQTTVNRLEVAFDAVDNPEACKSKQTASTDGKLVSYSELFRYADRTDYALMAFGTLGALFAGLSEPIQIVLFGDVVNSFNPSKNTPEDEFRAGVNRVARNFALVGIGVIIACFVQVACWSVTSARQAKRIRSAYVGAILNKEIGWFDVNEPMQLSTRVADSTVTIQEGMGRKLGDGINFTCMAVAGIVIGLIKGWQLALVLLAFTPVLAFTAYLSMKVLSTETQAGIDAYSKAGAVAQESLSNIRTVHMFNSIDYFVKKYEDALQSSTKAGIKKGLAVGWGTGLMFFTVFCTYATGLYVGAVKVANDIRDGCVGDGCYDGGRVLMVFFSIMMGALALGQAGPSIQAIYSARAAAYDVFAVIQRASLIDPLDPSGKKLDKVQGRITIDHVSFAYPSRPEVKVCSNYSLTIEPGQTVALVGPSGSGKSTVVSLLERFYDPLSGSVKLDGVDIRELNVRWLREQVGLVGQEPALFATSIMENIRHGCPSATDEQVIEAAKMANAYNFIIEFPQGFQTEVGERGTQLSGGQKQRIAIARAIIKNPAILLLDEATSALDTESERVVQESLDKLLATSNRTTIIVAHRLSTIRNASKIAVHSRGAIVELGTHDELMKIENGHYRMLVEAQNRSKNDDLDEATEAQNKRLHSVSRTSSRSSSYRKLERADSKGSLKAYGMEDSSVTSATSSDETDVSLRRIWKMSAPEWKYLLFGGVGATMNAAVFPVWGVLLTKVTVLFFQIDKPRDVMIHDARYWALGFVGLGVLFGASIMAQYYGFSVAGQRLVTRVRLSVYSSMLHQDIGWFDLDENTSGALVARLASDSATLQTMTSDMLNRGLVNVTTLVIGFVIAFYYSWKLTLVVLATTPIFVFASTIQAQMISGTNNGKEANDADNAAGTLLAEAIGSIRTVASFGMESELTISYMGFLDASKAADNKKGCAGGIAFGISQGVMFFNLAFLFYLGGKWVAERQLDFESMFMVLNVIMFATFAVGMAMQNMTDQETAKKAAANVLRTMDRAPLIDSTSTAGQQLSRVHGDIEFRGVQFTYPSRPDAQIYQNYSLKVTSGQTVALVGASGSGKSTAISLLERFYDPSAGSVTLDGVDLRQLQLPWLRERISLVSQEPVLFAGTIAENIAMGKPGATREEVMEAAKKANAYDFICNFPQGFDTDVGDRGAQVSGGQKQRIAIARAILRDPEVLLLDEATSALDNESERVVQASLDRLLALKRRTTIIVAHRLSTIRNADLIAVTRDGAIVEQGTHDELMAIPDGVYKALVARQMTATGQ